MRSLDFSQKYLQRGNDPNQNLKIGTLGSDFIVLSTRYNM